MERVAFTMRLLPGAEAEYRERHAHVWPEMLQALRDGGVSNYSIYQLDDRLIGIFDVVDFDAFRAHMAALEVNDRWQADMTRLIDPCTDPATGFHRRLEEIFRLD
ncbi:MAG: L-rhamnose mutarotase [Chloroflexota bacterium]